MERSSGSNWLSDVVEPLRVKFGGDLTLHRDGDAVRWEYGGQSAVLEFLPEGRIEAMFFDRIGFDIVARQPSAAMYRSRSTYRLSEVGCSRMIADMVDFFSGVREPVFTFVDAS